MGRPIANTRNAYHAGSGRSVERTCPHRSNGNPPRPSRPHAPRRTFRNANFKCLLWGEGLPANSMLWKVCFWAAICPSRGTSAFRMFLLQEDLRFDHLVGKLSEGARKEGRRGHSARILPVRRRFRQRAGSPLARLSEQFHNVVAIALSHPRRRSARKPGRNQPDQAHRGRIFWLRMRESWGAGQSTRRT
jgi:hypothetical protein